MDQYVLFNRRLGKIKSEEEHMKKFGRVKELVLNATIHNRTYFNMTEEQKNSVKKKLSSSVYFLNTLDNELKGNYLNKLVFEINGLEANYKFLFLNLEVYCNKKFSFDFLIKRSNNEF